MATKSLAVDYKNYIKRPQWLNPQESPSPRRKKKRKKVKRKSLYLNDLPQERLSLTIHTTSFDQDGDSKGGSDEDQDDLAIATPDDTALPSIPLRDDNVTTHKNDSEGNRESVPAIKHENDNSEHLKPNECNDTELENDTHTAHNRNLKSKEHILPKQENYVEANKSTHTDVGDAEVENQNAGSETTLTHYTDENENRTKDAQMYNKDRRVTFSQENNMNERAEEITEEGFAKEYEYRPHDKRRGKFFEELDDYERFKYFKSEYHMPSEQIRELTFRPKVNETKIIHQTYTGVDVNEWRESPNHARAESERLLKSRLRNHERKVSITPSYQRKDFMLSQFQGIVYHQMKDVYGKSPRDYTEKRFYNRLSQVQKDESERRSQMLQDKERRRRESTIRQTHQLRQVRDKYELGAMRRFMTQFVASKVTESHPANRKDFGLPETLDLQKRKASLKIYSPDLKDNANNRKVSLKPHSPDSVKDKVNKKKFDTLFKMTPRPIWRTDEDIKFEGYDSVLLDTEDENGEIMKQRLIVKDLIKEAKGILKYDPDKPDKDFKTTKSKKETTDYVSRRIPHRVGNTPREQKKRSRNSLPERGIALSDRTPQASRNRTKPAPLSKQNSLPAIKTEIKTKKWVDNKHSKNFLHAKIEYQVNKTNEELENGKENREQSEPISNRLTTSAAETSTRRSQTESEKTWQNHEPVETEIVASDENLSNDHVIDKSPELVDNTIKYSSVSRTEHNERKHDHGASFEIPSSHIKSKHYETRKLSVMISNKNPSDTDCKRANLSSSENDKSESIENVKTPNESQKLKLPFSSKDTTKNEHSYDSFNNTKVKKQLENKERTRKAYKINSDIKLPNSKLKVSKANKQKANTTKEPQTVTKYERKVSADIAPGLTHGKNGSQRDSVYESGKSTSPSNGINISKSVQINDSELVQETEMPDKRTRVPIVGASPSPSRKLYHNSRFPNIEAAMKMKLTDKVGVNTKEKTTVQERISAALNDKTTDLDKEDDRSISPEDTKGKAQWKDLVNKYLRTPIPVIGKTTTKVILETNDESDDDSDIDIFERAIRRHKLNIDDDDDDDDDDYDDDDDGD